MTGGYDSTYHRKAEPESPAYKAQLWDAAFGLQATDGLEPSAYARELANDNVYGRKSLDEVGAELERYYSSHGSSDSERTEEADKVSHRIVGILEDGSFSFDPAMLSVIHRWLFEGIDDGAYHPGEYKTEQLVKCEEVLNGDSVSYGVPALYARSLEMLFSRELAYAYDNYTDGPALSWADTRNLARFVANVWMVHPFFEGNTRTVAVFLELYLRSMGFDVDNCPFKAHSLYFRNALVRACYQNRAIGVGLDDAHLVAFLSRLLEEPTIELDYDALWCVPLFQNPERVRNVSLADARPVQQRLAERGITAKVLGAK
ncbi:MAG: Fic family protein [Coriobacteriales bacterium]|nr:Fic family protein [Coriobacteriales bacterium]